MRTSHLRDAYQHKITPIQFDHAKEAPEPLIDPLKPRCVQGELYIGLTKAADVVKRAIDSGLLKKP